MEVEASSASESNWLNVGTTIPVRNVQALASSAADELTADKIERYIQPDIDAHAVLAERSGDIPVLDLGKLLNAETGEAEGAKLRFACEEWGFFQVRSATEHELVRCFNLVFSSEGALFLFSVPQEILISSLAIKP
jgi:hypothetical protein